MSARVPQWRRHRRREDWPGQADSGAFLTEGDRLARSALTAAFVAKQSCEAGIAGIHSFVAVGLVRVDAGRQTNAIPVLNFGARRGRRFA